MKTFFSSIFIFLSIALSSQSDIDSVLSKTWNDGYYNTRQFSTKGTPNFIQPIPKSGSVRRTTTIGSKPFFQYFSITDSTITFRGEREETPQLGNHIFWYKYFGDSLLLDPISKDSFRILDYDALFVQHNLKHNSSQSWVLYDSSHFYHKESDFRSLSVSDPWKEMQVDYLGNVFYNFQKSKIHYGHYRDQLDSLELAKFLYYVKTEYIPALNRIYPVYSDLYHSEMRYINRDSTSVPIRSLGYESGRKFYRYLDSVVPIDSLVFQNYADGDSVEGVVIFNLRFNDELTAKGIPSYLASFENYSSEYHLYRLESDSAYYYRKAADIKDKPIYFISQALLTPNKKLALLLDPADNWFLNEKRLRAKPEDLEVFELNTSEELPDGFIIHTNRSNLGFRDLKQATFNYGPEYIYRTPFEIAFEDYILPDWEKYVKNSNKE